MLKRAPSSSANETTATGTRSATAKPAATPSAPSKRPPPRTLSRCEPTAHHGGGVSGHAHRLPAGSRSSFRPIASARRANQAAARSSSSVQASRVVAPLSSRPIGTRSESSVSSSAASITRR